MSTEDLNGLMDSSQEVLAEVDREDQQELLDFAFHGTAFYASVPSDDIDMKPFYGICMIYDLETDKLIRGPAALQGDDVYWPLAEALEWINS